MKSCAFLAIAVLAALPGAAQAQLVVPSGPTQAQKYQPAIAQLCAACHGSQGEGVAGAPRLAGQPRAYLEKQLRSYADGSRRNPAMEAMAKALSPQEMAGFAAYYAQIDAPAARVGRVLGGANVQAERGRALALEGDQTRQVQACINCHGPGGNAQPPAIPYLAGLDAGYLVAALHAWKDGTRKNDAGAQMATAVRGMTAEDITAVAFYYAGLPAPKPAPRAVVTPPAAPKVPHPVSAPAPQPGKHAATGQARELSISAKPGALINQPVRAGDAGRGRAIVAGGAYGCAACHAIPGIPGPKGIAGPPLTGLAGRSLLAGQLPNNAEVLAAFLQNPPALVPQTGMPNVGLDAGQARDIAAFLYTLEPPRAP